MTKACGGCSRGSPFRSWGWPFSRARSTSDKTSTTTTSTTVFRLRPSGRFTVAPACSKTGEGASERAEDQAFEVVRLRDGKEDRMVARLGPALDHCHSAMRVERCGGDGAKKIGLSHVVRARTRHEIPAGLE